jgi:hypothetical protein
VAYAKRIKTCPPGTQKSMPFPTLMANNGTNEVKGKYYLYKILPIFLLTLQEHRERLKKYE